MVEIVGAWGAMSQFPLPEHHSDEARAAAAYIAALTGELETIARHHGLATLGYLLTIAHLEAETAAHESAPSV
jgi:hypothetical protein